MAAELGREVEDRATLSLANTELTRRLAAEARGIRDVLVLARCSSHVTYTARLALAAAFLAERSNGFVRVVAPGSNDLTLRVIALTVRARHAPLDPQQSELVKLEIARRAAVSAFDEPCGPGEPSGVAPVLDHERRITALLILDDVPLEQLRAEVIDELGWVAERLGTELGTRSEDALDAGTVAPPHEPPQRAAFLPSVLAFRRGGSASAGFLELRNFPGDAPVIDGSGIPGPWMVTIDSLSYVRVAGLTFIRNDLPAGDGSGVRVTGSGQRIEVLDNVFRDFTGDSSMAVTVYGTSTSASIADVVIRGNTVRNCQPAPSEAITLNGNVERFEVSANLIEDVNYIGIDLIGGEPSINPVFGARDGRVFGNRVLRARDTQFGGYAAGIYSDGASRVVIERNVVAYCDQGIEVGAENPGWTSFDVTVRDNIVVANGKVGIAVGGYDATVGRVVGARILHNTLYANAVAPGGGDTELWINYADSSRIAGNVLVLGANPNALYNFAPTTNNVIDNNLWWRPLGPPNFEWVGQGYSGFASFAAGTGFEARGRYAGPRLIAPLGADGLLGTLDDDMRPGASSPCIDAGDAPILGFDALTDASGQERFVDTATVGDSGIGLAPRQDLGALERPRASGEVARICPALPNGTGAVARLVPSGATGLSGGPLVLTVTGAPPGVFGYFLLGGGGAANPVGAGVLCVQGPLVRFPAQLVNGSGGAARTVAWAQIPAGGQALVPGTTLVASFAHRDLVQGQVTFQFADALRWVLGP